MQVSDFIPAALAVLHPGIRPDADYLWIKRGDTSVLENWNEADFGALDMQAVEAEAERLAALAFAQAIKAEAGRRITERYPLWRQNNMLMRAVALTSQGLDALSDDEMAEANALLEAEAWITAMRQRSDELEAMQPVPENFMDDGWWTV